MIFSLLSHDLMERKTNRSHTGQSTCVERELAKQKYRMKELFSLVEKQHNLVKLIVEKMEIIAESEDQDGPEGFHSPRSGADKWAPVIRAVMSKRI
ncbi:transient receptor potential cation channel subfamily A member 1-like [Engraulis encrasicolus]|uniref:transient receptor potential cation channel subfamily A member 1-like n=1 Tax=Engraulis encrasicolus TaxID=184585 RepID=UPI002FCEA5A8